MDPRNSPKFWDRFAEGFRVLGVSRFAFRFRVLGTPQYNVVGIRGAFRYFDFLRFFFQILSQAGLENIFFITKYVNNTRIVHVQFRRKYQLGFNKDFRTSM